MHVPLAEAVARQLRTYSEERDGRTGGRSSLLPAAAPAATAVLAQVHRGAAGLAGRALATGADARRLRAGDGQLCRGWKSPQEHGATSAWRLRSWPTKACY